jgi:D-alanine-D-alanine ligase
MSKHVVVLMGGWSAEREVSLSSGAACAKALRAVGYRVTELDMKPDVAQKLAELKPDVVFNALHGCIGEDGCVQGLLNIMQIPYTHSGVMASSVAMDKPMAKRVFAAAGLRVPAGRVVARAEMTVGKDPMPRPYVVKPANEGSSVGVKLVFENDNFFFTPENWPYGEEVLVEEYIAGRELTVAVLNGKPLGVTEIRPDTGFYDYEHKYTDGKSAHLCPAPLDKAVYDEVMRQAVVAHEAVGCLGLSRSDFRYDEARGMDGLYILEINTQPGMTALSLSPEQAAYAGISFEQLVESLVKEARYG